MGRRRRCSGRTGIRKRGSELPYVYKNILENLKQEKEFVSKILANLLKNASDIIGS